MVDLGLLHLRFQDTIHLVRIELIERISYGKVTNDQDKIDSR